MKFNPVFLAVASSTANSTATRRHSSSHWSAVRASALQNAATRKSRDTNCNHAHRSKPYIVSEVCSEWTRKKLFAYVFLYAVQSMTPHTQGA